jgi:FtsP/CotA-like multicopper oxidase with cupredoxin domain
MHSHWGLQEQQLMTAPLVLLDPAAPADEQDAVMILNDSGMGHPMHLHGHVFQVVEAAGRRIAGALRDTVFVLPGQTVKVQFDAAYPATGCSTAISSTTRRPA